MKILSSIRKQNAFSIVLVIVVIIITGMYFNLKSYNFKGHWENGQVDINGALQMANKMIGPLYATEGEIVIWNKIIIYHL